MHADLK